jgi:hypothetical protein
MVEVRADAVADLSSAPATNSGQASASDSNGIRRRATLVGYARIEQDAHYTSDGIGGALLGWSVARAVVHRHSAPPNPKKLKSF